MIEVPLTCDQYDAITSEAAETVFISGVGAGKSFVLGAFIYDEARLVGSIGLVTAPVSDTLNNSTLPALKEVWSRLGLIEGTHYIIGSRPPRSWKIDGYTSRNSKIITWRWKSYTIIDGSDNFNKHRGLELDYVAADEFRDMKVGAWEMYRGRMRGKAKKAIGGLYRMLAVTTPPDDPKRIQKIITAETLVIRGSSYGNAKNLPAGYLEGLRRLYDENTYRREVLGQLIHSGGSTAYYCFSQKNIVEMPFNPSAPSVVCFDFNASAKKPMASGIIQEIGGLNYLTKEFVYKNSNTNEQCQKIIEFLTAQNFRGSLEITGDYSGNRKESNSTRSDFSIIEHYFRNYAGYSVRTRPTLAVKDRVASLNAQLRNYADERRLLIDKNCQNFIDDLTLTRFKENGVALDDTDPERTHASDSLSYWAYNYFPIDLLTAEITKK